MCVWGMGLRTVMVSSPIVSKPCSLFIYLFYLWLRWVFVAVRGLLIAVASLVAGHGL